MATTKKPSTISGAAQNEQRQNTSNDTAKQQHRKICKEYKITTADKWYEHQHKIVTENDEVTILWDMSVQIDREIKANRPDIIVKRKAKKECILTDMAITSERNTSVKVTEKLSKYKYLEIETNGMREQGPQQYQWSSEFWDV